MNTSDKPLVSVVITTYNQAAYIGQTLRSALEQTYAPVEVIVVDDGSTDDTPLRLAPFAGRITVIRQENRGVAGSRNRGILAARGELIAFLDGDDLWEPDKLSVQVDAALNHPGAGLIVANGVQFDESGVIADSLIFLPEQRKVPQGGIASGSYYEALLRECMVASTSQVMIPARVFADVGISNGRFFGASDYDLYIRIAERYDVTFINRSLIRWRYLPTSVSGPRQRRRFRYLPEEMAVLRKHLQECSEESRAMVEGLIARRLAEGAESLYYFGAAGERLFASSILLRLLRENRGPLSAVAFLAGLWSPEWLRSLAAGAARKMFMQKSTV